MKVRDLKEGDLVFWVWFGRTAAGDEARALKVDRVDGRYVYFEPEPVSSNDQDFRCRLADVGERTLPCELPLDSSGEYTEMFFATREDALDYRGRSRAAGELLEVLDLVRRARRSSFLDKLTAEDMRTVTEVLRSLHTKLG